MEVLKPETPDERAPTSDRRRSRRRSLTELPAVTGVNVRSQPVEVLDISAVGVRVRSRFRLLPGESSSLEIMHVDGPVRLGGRVLRSEVAAIRDRVMEYCIAIEFDSALAFIDQAAPVVHVPASADGAFVDLPLNIDADTIEPHDSLNTW